MRTQRRWLWGVAIVAGAAVLLYLLPILLYLRRCAALSLYF